MGAWDLDILTDDTNVDFLDELSELDPEDIVAAVADACKLVLNDPNPTETDRLNGLAAATIAAIWAGAPYTAGDVVEDYPFIRELIGEGDEELMADACQILEDLDTDDDVDSFIEALSSVE